MRFNLFSRLLACGLLALLSLSARQVLALGEIQAWKTSQGSQVHFLSARDLPMVDVRITFDAGSARDGKQPGIASLTNGQFIEGAGGLSTEVLLERFALLGAKHEQGVSRDMAWQALRSLSKPEKLEQAVDLLTLMLSKPDFPQASLERDRNAMLQTLAYSKKDPGSLAAKAFYHGLYGEHPYAIGDDGTEEGLNSLTVDDLRAFYQRYYVTENAYIAIVGDLDRAAAEALAERISAALPKGAAPAALPEPAPLSEGAHQHIDYPSSQTHILLGQIGYRRGDPDHFALYLGNHMLGGSGLVSRLSQKIREENGLAYSVYSYFSPNNVAGPFVTGLQTRNDQSEQALRLLREQLQDFVENGPSAEEVEAAKRNLSGSFALNFDSNAKLLQYLAVIGFHHLPLDYLHTWVERMQQVTPEQVHEAFKRHLHPDKMLLVTVGGEAK